MSAGERGQLRVDRGERSNELGVSKVERASAKVVSKSFSSAQGENSQISSQIR